MREHTAFKSAAHLGEAKGREVRESVYRRRISSDLEKELKGSRDRNLRRSPRGVEEECKGSWGDDLFSFLGGEMIL